MGQAAEALPRVFPTRCDQLASTAEELDLPIVWGALSSGLLATAGRLALQ